MKKNLVLSAVLAITAVAVSAGIIFIRPPTFQLSGPSGVVVEKGFRAAGSLREGRDFGRRVAPMADGVYHEFVATNMGDKNLIFDRPIFTGPNASDFFLFNFGVSQVTVPPGGAVTLGVGLRSSTIGSKYAVISCTTNDPSAPEFVFDVFAELVAAPDPVTNNLVLTAVGDSAIKYHKKTDAAKITWTMLVTNAGNVSADAGGVVRVYTSFNRYFGPDDPHLLDIPVKKLAVGKSKKIKMKYTFPQQPQYIFAELIQNGAASETELLDNIVFNRPKPR